MPSMPTIRNPFRKTAPVVSQGQINASTDSFASSTVGTSTETSVAFQRSSDNVSKLSSIGRPYLSITPSSEFPPKSHSGGSDVAFNSTSAIPISREKPEQYAGEYKLSVVNDSGVYLPPSPTEKKSFWKRSTSKVNSPIDRTSLDEPFTISRESCESYRRSFDISARSPMLDTSSRTSLDSRNRPSLEARTRASFDTNSKLRPLKIVESAYDGFEEVKLDDGNPKKRGLFSRFGGNHSASPSTTTTVSASNFKFGTKKDGTEVVHENELKSIPLAKDNGVETSA